MDYRKKITTDLIEEILSKGVRDMPQNPGAQGYSERQIRGFYYIPEKMILEFLSGFEDDFCSVLKLPNEFNTLKNNIENDFENFLITYSNGFERYKEGMTFSLNQNFENFTKQVNLSFDELEAELNNKFNELEQNSTASQVIENTNNIKALFNLQLNKNVLAYDDAEITEEIQQTGGTDLSGLSILDNSYATVNKISGDTIRCENLIPIYAGEKVQTINGVTFTVNNDGTIIANGTATGGNAILTVAQNISASGTVFLSGSPTGGGFGAYYMQAKLDNVWSDKIDSGTGCDLVVSSVVTQINIEISVGATLNNVIFKPMLNYGTSAKPYQPYFAGLKNAQISGVKSVGRNFFNSEILLRAEGWTENNGVYSGNDLKLYQAFSKANGGFFGELNLDKQATLSFWGKNSTLNDNTSAFGFMYTDGTENIVRVTSTEWTKYTLVSNAGKTIKYVFATLFENDTVSLKEVCMKVGANEFDYEPYTESVMQLPQTVELGKWDYIENGQIVRQTSDIITITGNEAWYDSTSGFVCYDIISTDENKQNSYRVVSSYYQTWQSSTIPENQDMCVFVHMNGIYITDSRFAGDVDAFKAFLQSLVTNGTPLKVAYQLATPTYEPITFDNKYLVWDKGIEQVITPTDEKGLNCFDYGSNTTEENNYYVIVGGNE